MQRRWLAGLVIGLVGGWVAGRSVDLGPRPPSSQAPAPPAAFSATAPSPNDAATCATDGKLALGTEACVPLEAGAGAESFEPNAPAVQPVEAPYCGLTADYEVRFGAGKTGAVQLAGGLFDFARYQGHDAEPVGTGSVINGAYTHVAQLEVRDPPEDVARFYRRQFALNDITPLEGAPMGPAGPHYMSYRPHGGKLMNVITLVPTPEGTQILASVADPEELMPGKTTLPADVPGPPGAINVMVNEVVEGSGHQRNIAFLVPKSSIAQVKQFYLETMARAGFTPEESAWSDPDSRTSWRASFTAGHKSVALSAREEPPGSSRIAVDIIDVNP